MKKLLPWNITLLNIERKNYPDEYRAGVPIFERRAP
jgi:hypothetical protein